MEWLDENVITGIVTVFMGALLIIGKWWVGMARFKAALKEYIPIVYDVVKDIAAHTETEIDDKLALALGKLKEILAAENIKLTPKREKIAEGMIRSFHVYTKESKVKE